ncbi:MAG TPA: PIN domain-containing protein [Thermoanaerobaculia bacterium]|nr:PIN domain-containing protein [Thermoanaerobaculia bacterium]
MKAWLLDTGPLVAYIDATEKQSPRVAARLDTFTGQLLTTTAVITEAMHLLATDRRGPALLAEFVARSGMQIFDFTDAAALAEAARRMEKYADIPMDYADATLVLLAERLGVFEILTLDYRGFTVFRSSKGKSFSMVLPRSGD